MTSSCLPKNPKIFSSFISLSFFYKYIFCVQHLIFKIYFILRFVANITKFIFIKNSCRFNFSFEWLKPIRVLIVSWSNGETNNGSCWAHPSIYPITLLMERCSALETRSLTQRFSSAPPFLGREVVALWRTSKYIEGRGRTCNMSLAVFPLGNVSASLGGEAVWCWPCCPMIPCHTLTDGYSRPEATHCPPPPSRTDVSDLKIGGREAEMMMLRPGVGPQNQISQ